ncbi:hypothetical protein [Streptomyces sp. SID5643]|uniref:hypothetical protein n=1 Tax=Streptomyces sp. SID5643 TaxID=2690307 RepID=UPI001F3AC3B1|nr:hypothetical protein [Streptomyces sp. SID5643]
MRTQKAATITHTQLREVNSCQPTRSSCTRPGLGAGAAACTRISAKDAAASAKPAASTASPQPGPTAATSTPPSDAPTIIALLLAIRESASAARRDSAGTVWGSRAWAAGG